MACIAFSGTYTKKQWYSNLKISLKHPSSLTSDTSIKIHQGYDELYSSLRKRIHDWWRENNSGIQHLFITGHSLGGALSTLCAFDFATKLNPSVQLVHYAMSSPRVGNVEFSTKFDQISPYSIRVYNTEDVVPSLPPSVWNNNVYQHICVKRGAIAFTRNLGTLSKNHIEAYEEMPEDITC